MSLQKVSYYVSDQASALCRIPRAIYLMASTKTLDTVEKTARFIYPLMSAMEKWGGFSFEGRPFLSALQNGSEWTKEILYSRRFVMKCYSVNKEEGIVEFALWEVLGRYNKGSLGVSEIISRFCGLVSSACATIEFWNPQEVICRVGAPIVHLSSHLENIASRIGRNPIYTSLLPENIKPLKDRFYALYATVGIIHDLLSPVHNTSLFEQWLDLTSKIAKLTTTIFSGSIYFTRREELCLFTSLFSGTVGMIQIAMDISKINPDIQVKANGK